MEASRETTTSPVVVAVHDSPRTARLFRTAIEEAMGRHCNLVVLDYLQASLHDTLEETADMDQRERKTLQAICSNRHVNVVRLEPDESDLENTVGYCESTEATLLILAADHIGNAAVDESLTNRLFNGRFDLLIVADEP